MELTEAEDSEILTTLCSIVCMLIYLYTLVRLCTVPVYNDVCPYGARDVCTCVVV